jgi:hypothetical protein
MSAFRDLASLAIEKARILSIILCVHFVPCVHLHLQKVCQITEILLTLLNV